MGELKKKSEVKEVLLNREITEQDIAKFNEMSPITITITNTRKQSSSVLTKLNKDIKIRVLGGFDETRFPEYKNEKYYKQTEYSPLEIARIIDVLNRIELNINPEWSDLEKATYGYITIMASTSPKHEKEELEDSRPLQQILNGKADSFGLAFIYKELMERQGIACRFFQKPGEHAWNEVLIDGEYYPADLFLDTVLNEERIKNNQFELKNFLSDKEFYYMPEHNLGNKKVEHSASLEKTIALDHSEIQKAIDKVLHPEEKKPIPKIPLKSKELQKALETSEISSAENFSEKKEIKIDFTSQEVSDVKEDLIQISKYYPNALDNVRLSNNTGKHINMQEIVDAVYEGRKNEEGNVNNPTQLIIESNNQEDFDIDFSKAPEVDFEEDQKVEDISYSQKISFVNTSSNPVKLPNLSGKIPNSIDTISIQDCDVNGFDIRVNKELNNPPGVLGRLRKLELVGGNTHGISDIVGLEDVIELTVDKLSDTDFTDVMNIAISNASTMPKLFDLSIKNQNLSGRQFLSEIKNPNIVNLLVNKSRLDNIVGLDTLRNQLINLSLQGNHLSMDDLKQANKFAMESKIISCFFGNTSLWNAINNLSGNIITDETYNYLDSYFGRSGYLAYRNMQYRTKGTSEEKQKEMLRDLAGWSFEGVPYFIEDAELFREKLPYVNNPMMVKDLTTFQNYLNNSSNYFEQAYLSDGNLWLTLEQLNYLISSGKKIPQNVYIKINTVSELNNSELEVLVNKCNSLGINLKGINVFDDRCIDPTNPNLHNFDEIDTHLDSYEIDEYKKIRSSLDEITDGILPTMKDVEKFAVVYHRLAEKISQYDVPVQGDTYSKEHAIYQARNRNKSRNLSEGLIEQSGFDVSTNSTDPTLANRSVCAGYADILKNALNLVGIESCIDTGNAIMNITTGKPEGGHEWNKIKIDGKWYYGDLCWDAGKNSYRWALKGSDSFVRSGIQRNLDSQIKEVNCHITKIQSRERNEMMEHDDYDQAELSDAFYRVRKNQLPYKYRINIPEDPDFTFNPTLDIENIKQEYKDRKNDMLAKFYGDKDYQRKYEEVAARYRANEVEVTNTGVTYRTIQDYAEREEDEKFLILGEYKDSLERMTKYENGDTSVYSGTDDQIRMQYEKDRQYVETRNYTFDQHKNTQKDLGTLGKYGETLPYIPRQQGIVKNGLRVVGNVGIFARNIVAPAYRFVGKYVAQPLHRVITRGKDASPYRNNPYHRFVARRDYFKDVSNENDAATGKRHPIRNYIMSNVNAIAKYKDGNEAVLKAGAFDIQENLKMKETQRLTVDFYNSKKIDLESKIATLEELINNHPDAENIVEAQNDLTRKRAMLSRVNDQLHIASTSGKITDIQTDAVSQTQHDIASKEVNTYRVAVIKGVAKLGVKKFVGPKLKNWLMERKSKTIETEEPYQTTIFVEKEFKEPSKTVSITEQQPYYDIEVDDLIENAKNKTVKMYRSVSGGNRGQIDYTIKGNEVCSGFHFQDGTKWGTGFSGNAPLMTDKTWPTTFLDANNNLRADLTFSEIAKAISNGELSEEILGNMTFQIGNKGWVYANELFEGVTKEVEVGTKIVEGATYTKFVPELVERTRTVSKVIENQRIVNALNTLNKVHNVNNVIGKVDTVHNAGEILRPTDSSLDSNKTKPREYDYDDSEFYL